jgi:hypothetical protein
MASDDDIEDLNKKFDDMLYETRTITGLIVLNLFCMIIVMGILFFIFSTK